MIDEKKLIEELKEKICNIPAIEKAYEMFYHNSCYNCAITTAELLIEKQPKVGEWIPCSERLPEENQIVMCSVKKEYAFHRIVVQRFDNRDYWHNGIVEAWMPLPEPYKAGDT